MSVNEQRAQELAETFRRAHGLDDRPLGDLFDLIHATVGCDVMAIEAGEAEHGLTMQDPDRGTVVIAVATRTHPMRQRSSLAHELGHVVAGDLAAKTAAKPGSRSPQEIRADAFARHLLLPLGAVRARVPAGSVVTEQTVADLVHEFGLPPHAVAIQLKQAGLLRSTACDHYRTVGAGTLATRYGWASQYKAMRLASSQPRAPQDLMRKAVQGYQLGVLGLAEIAAWYGVDQEILLQELGEPRPSAPEMEPADDGDDDEPLFPDGLTDQAPK